MPCISAEHQPSYDLYIKPKPINPGLATADGKCNVIQILENFSAPQRSPPPSGERPMQRPMQRPP